MTPREVYSPAQCRDFLTSIKKNVPDFIARCKRDPNIKMYEVYRGLKAWGIDYNNQG